MIELFDKKFVYFMWDDELVGKKVFVADGINTLIECVEKGTATHMVQYTRNMRMPFERDDFVCYRFAYYRFAYYDPNYEVKKAFNEGETIQYQIDNNVWVDIYGNRSEEILQCRIDEDVPLRIKPRKEWIAYLSRLDGVKPYLTVCREDTWESVQKDYGAKTKLFVGSEDEATKWFSSRKDFTDIIKAWEDGKTIQSKGILVPSWVDTLKPAWHLEEEYRIKPEEQKKEWWNLTNPQIGQIEIIPFASFPEEEDGWYPCDGRKMPKEFVGNKAVEELIATYGTPGSMRLPDMRPANCAIYLGCPSKSSKMKYRPYINSVEMIADFIARFKVKCLQYAEPLIWLSLKEDEKNRFLVTGFHEDSIEITKQLAPMDMGYVFEKFVYLGGSPVGMEVKE